MSLREKIEDYDPADIAGSITKPKVTPESKEELSAFMEQQWHEHLAKQQVVSRRYQRDIEKKIESYEDRSGYDRSQSIETLKQVARRSLKK